MDEIILSKLEKNNKTHLIKQDGQWLLGTKTILIVHTEPIDNFTDGSLNGLELLGIGKYSIQLDETDIYILTFLNETHNQNEYVIVPRKDLLNRINQFNELNGNINIRLWLTKDYKLMESFGCGAEGEFMALWLDKKRDFTEFLNNWSIKE